MRGFSYCGKGQEEFGDVYYMPDAKQRGDHMSDYEVFTEENKGGSGAIKYGTRVKPREFELPVYYENLTSKDLSRLVEWFDRRRKGEQIFEDRQYAAYQAEPSGRVQVQDHKENRDGTVRHHGTMIVYLTAYDPFAKLLVTTDEGDTLGADDEVTLLRREMMPTAPTVNSKKCLIYNPGTEVSGAVIRVAGDGGDEIIIRNRTTGQECIIRGMTRGITTDAGRYLEINGATGRVDLVGASRELAFELHDGGYIAMAPNHTQPEEVSVTYTQGSATISGHFTPDMKGKFIWLCGAWRKLTTWISSTKMGVDSIMEQTGRRTGLVAVMNEIEIIGGELTRLEIEFEPKVR